MASPFQSSFGASLRCLCCFFYTKNHALITIITANLCHKITLYCSCYLYWSSRLFLQPLQPLKSLRFVVEFGIASEFGLGGGFSLHEKFRFLSITTISTFRSLVVPMIPTSKSVLMIISPTFKSAIIPPQTSYSSALSWLTRLKHRALYIIPSKREEIMLPSQSVLF